MSAAHGKGWLTADDLRPPSGLRKTNLATLNTYVRDDRRLALALYDQRDLAYVRK